MSNSQTHVVSLRVPAIVNSALARSASNAGLSVSGGLGWLLSNSFDNSQLLFPLADCPDVLDAKLDVRIPRATFEQLKAITDRLSMSISVYIRKLLYHFFVTKRLKYVQSQGHYTLAGSHD